MTLHREIIRSYKTLDSKSLFKEIQSRLQNSCLRDKGFIQKIKSVNTRDKIISPYTGMICYTCDVECETLLPQEGETYTGVVTHLTNDGIFALVENLLKVIIPYSGTDIAAGDQVKIRIVRLRYQLGRFVAIGSLE
jgi:DNA-directed RNA polymerase subunit E'/Rpb7